MSKDISLSFESTLALLKKGNEAYQAHRKFPDAPAPDRVLPPEQAYPPSVAMLTCSDSRVDPEQIFWMPEGAIFAVKIPGNGFSPLVAESLFFAVDNFPIQVILVMGHEECGAVIGRINGTLGSSPRLQESLSPKLPEYSIEKLSEAVKTNVQFSKEHLIARRPILKPSILGAVFNISSGAVTFFPQS